MELKINEDKFDLLQSAFLGGIIDSIKENLDKSNLPEDISRKLVEDISFSVATILDGSVEVSFEGITAKPVITFQENENSIISSGTASWMHEYVFGTIADIYDN